MYAIPPTLRIAFAGARRLPCAPDAVAARCAALFDALAVALSRLHPAAAAQAPPARLVLLTGLADGADQIAADAFLSAPPGPVRREHGAVLPFDEATYRAHSPIEDKDRFDRLIGLSSPVIELDGRWLPHDAPEGEALARHARARAYRAQARTLLQRADLLIAVWDPAEPGRAGGTAETLRSAIEADLPVLVLCPAADGPGLSLHALASGADLDALPYARDEVPAIPDEALAAHLADLVAELVPAAPSLAPLPPRSWLQDRWSRFEKKFEPPPRRAKAAAAPAGSARVSTAGSPFHTLRQHARELNARYSGRYRGGFLSNFRFAALATTLAAASLAIMVLGYKFGEGHLPIELKLVLLPLALGKFALVFTIWQVTERGRHGRWNEHAVNARYLAETLRLLFWLPALGKLRTPQRSGEHHADEQIGGSGAEALLGAAVRAAPLDTGLTAVDGPMPASGPRRVRIEPLRAIEQLRSEWIDEQRGYHRRNAKKLGRMAESLSRRAERMNALVIFCVALDILLLVAGLTVEHLPIPLDVLKVLLIASAAALPAAVASTYGIREQSEAKRLSGRSRQLAAALDAMDKDVGQLLARMRKPDAPDPGAWTLESLDLAERCARLVAEDVAEWSVLYGKGMPEI